MGNIELETKLGSFFVWLHMGNFNNCAPRDVTAWSQYLSNSTTQTTQTNNLHRASEREAEGNNLGKQKA
jgi:hypothetical protein